MTSERTPSLPRRLVIFAAALAAAAGLFAASPAAAHDELLGSDPAADATVPALPEQLSLTFNAPIAPDLGASEVQVTDAAGNQLAAGAPTAVDNVLTQPLDRSTNSAAGAVTVLWKVVSSDGHPISGQLAFTVETASSPTPTPTSEPSPTETPSPTPTATEAPGPAPTQTSAPAEPGGGDSTFADVSPWVLGGLLLAAVGGAVIYLLVSRARRERALEGPPDASGPESETPSER